MHTHTSHPGTGSTGLLVIHGFTGTPVSVAPIVDTAIAADLAVEAPLLSGHGTVIDDMVDLTWHQWVNDVAVAADNLARRVERFVVVGQSMGGALALNYCLAANHVDDRVAGIVCINPLTQPRSLAEMEMIDDFIADGIEIVPGSGSDIADPDAHDVGYDGTPLRALRSVLVDGIEPLSARYGDIVQPALVYTSRNDHVVEPSNSVRLVEQLGGPVEHVWLDDSFHVAAIDIDRHKIVRGILSFLSSVTT